MRAGEAKLRERVRDDAFSSLVARMARCPPASGGALDFVPAVSDDGLQGLTQNVHLWHDILQGRKNNIPLWDDSLQGCKEHI